MPTEDVLCAEADEILALTGGTSLAAHQMIERQFGVLVLRTQVLLSLCG